MGNQSRKELSPAEIGRRPSDDEVIVLFKLQKKIFTPLVQSPHHVALLERYWNTLFTSKQNRQLQKTFELVGNTWHSEGGFTTDQPSVDLRPMGELGLELLVLFAENFEGETKMMRRKRGGYPFVMTAMAVARGLCAIFHLIDPIDPSSEGKFPITDTLYWQLIENELSFFKIFAIGMFMFEEMYCEAIANNRTVQEAPVCSLSLLTTLVENCRTKFQLKLGQAPLSLDDLQDICTNASIVINKEIHLAPFSKFSDTSADTVTTTTGTTSIRPNLSTWSQRGHRSRKDIRSIGKHWGKDIETLSVVVTSPQEQEQESNTTPLSPASMPAGLEPTISTNGIKKLPSLLPKTVEIAIDRTNLFEGLQLNANNSTKLAATSV
jgi:hypothetical protein